MVEAVTSAFPDVPVDNVVYSLTRTRSAQSTSEIILERGTLPPVSPHTYDSCSAGMIVSLPLRGVSSHLASILPVSS